MQFRFFILLVICCSANAQVYKCKGADGATSMQQTPCASTAHGTKVDVKPSGGHAAVGAPTQKTDSSAAGQSYSEKASKLEKERRMRDLIYQRGQWQQERARLDREMEQKLTALRNTKGRANNNLAGATWEQSLSTEMVAITESYKIKTSAVDGNIADVNMQIETLSK